MKAIKDITDVMWVNNKKTRVTCRFVYEDDESEILSVPRSDGEHHWDLIMSKWTIEKIDEFTSTILQRQEEQRLKHIARKKESIETKRASALFNSKIEAFEMPEVIAAPKHLKAQIRKALTTTHVIALVSLCIAESIKKQQESLNNGTDNQ